MEKIVVSFTHAGGNDALLNNCISCCQGNAIIHTELMFPARLLRVCVTMDNGINMMNWTFKSSDAASQRFKTFMYVDVASQTAEDIVAFVKEKQRYNLGYNYCIFCVTAISCILPTCVSNYMCGNSGGGGSYTCSSLVYSALRSVEHHILDPALHPECASISPAQLLDIMESETEHLHADQERCVYFIVTSMEEVRAMFQWGRKYKSSTHMGSLPRLAGSLAMDE